MIKQVLLISGLLWSSIVITNAQMESEIGLFGGVSAYQGDLTKPQFDGDHLNWIAGLHFRQFFIPQLALRLSFLAGHISADEQIFIGRQARALALENRFWEGGALLEIHPLGQARLLNQGFFRPSISPFLFTGIAAIRSTPELTRGTLSKWTGKTVSDQMLLAFPFGAGVRLNIFEKWTVVLELNPRLVWSDYLDGISASNTKPNHDWLWSAGCAVLYTLQAGRGAYRFR